MSDVNQESTTDAQVASPPEPEPTPTPTPTPQPPAAAVAESTPAPTAETTPAKAPPQRGRPTVPVGPVVLVGGEMATMAGVGMWRVAGWPGLALCAVTAAGVSALAVSRLVRAFGAPDADRRVAGRGGQRLDMPKLGGRRRSVGPGLRIGRGLLGAGSFKRAHSAGAKKNRGGPPPSFGRGPAKRAGNATASVPGIRRGVLKRAMHGPGGARPVGRLAHKARKGGLGVRRAATRIGRGAERTGRAALAAHRTARGGGSLRQAAQAARKAAVERPHGHVARRLFVAVAASLLGAGWAAIWRGGVWAVGKIRARRRPEPAPADSPESPSIDTKVNRPANRTRSTNREAASMSEQKGQPEFVVAAEEFAEALRTYEPPEEAGGMMQFLDHMRQLPDALNSVADGFRSLAKHCDEDWPLHEHIGDLIAAMAMVQDQIADTADDIPGAIEQLHAADVGRHETPRPSEERWNV